MSNENVTKTLMLLLAIVLGVAGTLYARVNLGMSEQALTAWLESARGTLVLAGAVIWVAVIGFFIIRARS